VACGWGSNRYCMRVTSSPEITLLTISAVCFLRPEGTAPQLKPKSEESAGLAESAELLTVRKQGTSRFMLPGGKLDPGEDAQQAAVREVAEELGLTIDSGDLTLLGEFSAVAANEAGTWVAATIYRAPLPALPHAAREIAELRWTPIDRPPEDLAPLLAEHVVPALLRS